jgi:two-component system, OmpR family, sensor histidine kinase ChvG
MADAPGGRIGRAARSLRVQGFVLLVVLVALPVIVSTVLGDADAERRLLLLNAVGETGDAIAAGLTPTLRDLRLAETDTLRQALARFAAPERSIQILLRPASEETSRDYFFIATDTPASPDLLAADRKRIVDLGILPDLSHGCTDRFVRARDASLLRDGTEVLTSVTSVEGAAGCWAIVIANGGHRLLGALEPRPYWERPDVRFAIGVYGLMAILIVAIFASVWLALLRFRRLALSSAEQALFVLNTDIPELGPLAAAFDGMVRRLRQSAAMLRQAAEDNAHAFKGPIATIRLAIETPFTPATEVSSMRAIANALDRLDGLVQSARHLDNAAAELLEPKRQRIDLSALVHGFIDSQDGLPELRGVRLESVIQDGIFVAAQEEQLETILENLVDNAIGFSGDGGTVTVRLIRRGAEAILTVEDEGPGVDPGRLEEIFERYHSDRPRPDETPHFGIGLWLVRQNATSFGGRATAANRTPHGLIVTVTLPLT